VAVILHAYAFLDDLVLLYPVYALLFADTGLSVAQTSSLFVLWSAAGIALEVPSGAWADAVSRRLLLVVGPFLTAAGFLLWVLVPSYWAFAAGFLLWGAKGAFGSGALEALVYEELERLGAADRYAALMGPAQAAGTVASLIAMAVAAPVMAAGGYLAVGLASVAACVLTGLVAALFPEHRVRAADEDEGEGYLETLRAGVAEARASRPVRHALLLVPVVTAVWGALDEYTPLLVREVGVPDATVPLLLLVLYVGVAAGGLLGAVAPLLTARRLGLLLLAAALATAIGALSGHAAGIVPLALAFCGFQLATVAVDARLQATITGPARATVTSLSGLVTDLASIAAYAGYAVAAQGGHGVAFAVFAALYLPVGVRLLLWRARVRT
jgi:MFS family permease